MTYTAKRSGGLSQSYAVHSASRIIVLTAEIPILVQGGDACSNGRGCADEMQISAWSRAGLNPLKLPHRLRVRVGEVIA